MNDRTKPSLSDIVQRDKEELAKGYPKWFRILECLGLILFFSFAAIIAWRMIFSIVDLWFLFIPAAIIGWIFSDFIGGVVHWAGDTWGSIDLPLLGPALIRPFREHHVDQLAITRHDFIETNAACALAGNPILFSCLFLSVGKEYKVTSFIVFFVFFMTIFVLFTNQIHKWAHSPNPNRILRILQSMRILLNPVHHQIHHTPPFNKYYCITTGWMNPFLNYIQFFPRMERFITKYTNALPRREDIGVNAAEKLI
jgi:plasmanylethanolamine desaturase